MIATTGQLEQASGSQNGNEEVCARLRGGGIRNATDRRVAAPDTLPGEDGFANEAKNAGRAGGEDAHVNGKSGVTRKNKRRSLRSLMPERIMNDDGGDGGRDTATDNPRVATPPDTSGKGGEGRFVTEASNASLRRESKGDGSGATPNAVATGNDGWENVCKSLQELQRRKAATLKSRIMIDNQLAALVSTELGYHSGMEEADRKTLRKQAEALIKAINSGDDHDPVNADVRLRVAGIVQSAGIARDGFDLFLSEIEKEMVKLAKQLPVAEWCQQPDQRGFGILSLATVVGEAGDLSLYANPAKLWKRLGLAPYQGKMPSTWRRTGGLSAEQWTEVGYSPRRRSIMYVIGENIVKQNKSIYRQRYDETKASAAANHPDWNKQRCHYHGMLLAVKRLVRDLWRAWRQES